MGEEFVKQGVVIICGVIHQTVEAASAVGLVAVAMVAAAGEVEAMVMEVAAVVMEEVGSPEDGREVG